MADRLRAIPMEDWIITISSIIVHWMELRFGCVIFLLELVVWLSYSCQSWLLVLNVRQRPSLSVISYQHLWWPPVIHHKNMILLRGYILLTVNKQASYFITISARSETYFNHISPINQLLFTPISSSYHITGICIQGGEGITTKMEKFCVWHWPDFVSEIFS